MKRITDSHKNSAHIHLEGIEGVRPRTEFAVGSLEQIQGVGKQYEPANKRESKQDYWDSPFVFLFFKNKGQDYQGYAKVAIPADHKDVDRNLLEYIDGVKTELVSNLKQHDPECVIGGRISVRGSEDSVILNMIKRYGHLDENVRYEIGSQKSKK